MKTYSLLLIVVAAFVLLYAIVNAPIHWMWKFVLGVAEMFIIGELLIKKYGFAGEQGVILFKSRYGLKLIEGLTKYKEFWKFFSDVGAVTAYGAFALILLQKVPSLRAILCGFLLLTILSGVVGPFVLPFLASVMDINMYEKPIKKSFAAENSLIFFFLSLIVLYGGGIFAVLFSSVIIYAAIILLAIYNSIFVGTDNMAKIAPGVAPLLPGVNLPLVEGIIALLIILVVHEGAHAVLARIARVPILSSGVVFFGVIPIGAFVEPNEEILKRTPRTQQTSVLLAGSTANLVASVIFFAFFIIFLYATQLYYGKVKATALEEPMINFIYVVLGLSFSLNFVIGTINLLPLPFFDGYRALEINIKNKKVVDTFMTLTAIALLVNLLPWLFR
jgi:membrane-associated protease RseP (regulator of RpoE activity)